MDAIWDFLMQHGASAQDISNLSHTYTLLMVLPFVATFVGIGRYIFGLTTISIYAPIVLTFVFYEMGYENNQPNFFNGIKLGYTVFFVVLITTTLLYYYLMKRIRMHYIPKTSIIITAVSMAVIIFLIIASYIGFVGFVALDVFSLIMIASLSERLISVYTKKTIWSGIQLALQTILLSTVAYGLITLTNLPELVNDIPWIILLVLVINIILGQFTGLRLYEYYKFRDILFNLDSDDPQTTKK